MRIDREPCYRAAPPDGKITDHMDTLSKIRERMQHRYKKLHPQYIEARRRYGLADDEE